MNRTKKEQKDKRREGKKNKKQRKWEISKHKLQTGAQHWERTRNSKVLLLIPLLMHVNMRVSDTAAARTQTPASMTRCADNSHATGNNDNGDEAQQMDLRLPCWSRKELVNAGKGGSK